MTMQCFKVFTISLSIIVWRFIIIYKEEYHSTKLALLYTNNLKIWTILTVQFFCSIILKLTILKISFMGDNRSKVDHRFNIHSVNLGLWKIRIWQMKYQQLCTKKKNRIIYGFKVLLSKFTSRIALVVTDLATLQRNSWYKKQLYISLESISA